MRLDVKELLKGLKYYRLEDVRSFAVDKSKLMTVRHPTVAWLLAIEAFLHSEGYIIIKKPQDTQKGDNEHQETKTNYNKSMTAR